MSSTNRHVVLKTVVFMGSARDITPPWGGASRLGDGILNWVKNEISKRASTLGGSDVKITHDMTVFDPLVVFGKDGALAESGAEIKTPHFFFKKGEAPTKMDEMAETIRSADCYVIVTPEYNHSLPPALSGMMGTFGGSSYACKPSGIVTYSPSPYGGSRVAVALRPFLSELGCLPVSKLACFSDVGDTFNEDGSVKDESNRQLKQLDGLLDQLEWLAVACLNQREAYGVP
ncbi:MAG: chromate reductase [Bacillariaceae sp.]|jgi:NAD(P)H-dependent FMN reductase